MSVEGKRILNLVPSELHSEKPKREEDESTRQSRLQREKAQRIIALSQARKLLEEAERLLRVLPQGAESTLDADLLDGLHAAQIIAKAASLATKKVALKFRVTGGGARGYSPSAGSIADFGTKDHDLLDGLLDDDHTQYVPVDGVARQLADAGYPNALLLDGSRTMLQDLPMTAEKKISWGPSTFIKATTTRGVGGDLVLVIDSPDEVFIDAHMDIAGQVINRSYFMMFPPAAANAIFYMRTTSHTPILFKVTTVPWGWDTILSFHGQLATGSNYVDINQAGDITMLADKTLTTGVGTKHDGLIIKPAAEVQTTDATQTTVDSITLLDENTYHVEAEVAGVKNDGTDRATYHLACTVYRTAAGGATLQGAVTSLHTQESDANWDATFTVNGNDLRVSVTGVAATTVEWGCTMLYLNMSN